MKTNEAVLDLVKEKETLLNNLRSRRWYIKGHTPRHNKEFNSTCQKIRQKGKAEEAGKDVLYKSNNQRFKRHDPYKQLKDKVQDRELWRTHLL